MRARRAGVLAILLLLFVLFAFLVMSGRLYGWETAVYTRLSSWTRPGLTDLMRWITHMGDGNNMLCIVLALLLLPATRLESGVPAALSTGGAAVLNRTLKLLFARPRPDGALWLTEAGGYSFPSGHSMSSMALYLLLALVLWGKGRDRAFPRPLAVLCGILPIAIGVSRVYLGVHYAGDVLCGWLLGAVPALAVDAARPWLAGAGNEIRR